MPAPCFHLFRAWPGAGIVIASHQRRVVLSSSNVCPATNVITMKRLGLGCAVTLALVASVSALAGPYSTSFPLTETPISEGGNWINGQTVGLDWKNVNTKPGLAYGADASGIRVTTTLRHS